MARRRHCPANRLKGLDDCCKSGMKQSLQTGLGLLALATWFCLGSPIVASAAESTNRTAEAAGGRRPKISITGLGWLQDRKLKRAIMATFPDRRHEGPLDANFVEDSFVVLHNQLVTDGYQKAVLRAELTLTDGHKVSVDWDGKTELAVPRPLAIQGARFTALRGPLFYFDTLQIKGLTAIPPAQATGYFYKTEMLLRLKTNRRFSRTQLNNSMNNLRQQLVNLGYRDATVTVARLEQDEVTGKVQVNIQVNEGRVHRVATVNVVVMDAAGRAVSSSTNEAPNTIWSPAWEQDFVTRLRNREYSTGHPDARVDLKAGRADERDGAVYEQLEATVTPGAVVKLGDVRIQGAKKSRRGWLRKMASVAGPLLDRVNVDAARERLSRQGVFNFVGVRFEPDTGPRRDVVFDVEEGKRINFSLLAGYGSYDQFFGGAELEQYNLWGIGHAAQLRGMASTKTQNVVYTYNVPEFLAPHLNLFANLDGLLRKELTFERQEITTDIGLRKVYPGTGVQGGLRYSYQFLKTQDSPDFNLNNNFTKVSAIILDGQIERRDNPLAPRRGFHLSGNLEVANPALASDANYEMLQAAASVHVPLLRGLVLHAGLQHGVIFSPNPTNDIPFSKRFFPGGENSVRGYQRGGASPYNLLGQQIGAETFLQWNLELEQFLTEHWSVVGFVDGAGVAAQLADYPFDEVLWSAGGGIRWNTIIGPVRVEYGYNLHRRQFDPVGTLNVSIGFPF